MSHVSGAVISQIMVEFFLCRRDVMITATIDDIQALACVNVIEAQPVLLCGWNAGFCGMPQRRQQKKENKRERTEFTIHSPKDCRKYLPFLPEFHFTMPEEAHVSYMRFKLDAVSECRSEERPRLGMFCG